METNYFAIALVNLDIYVKLITDMGAGIVAYEVYLGEKQNAPTSKKAELYLRRIRGPGKQFELDNRKRSGPSRSR